ncbi:MAG TPA: DUF2071 domain-containing protein [Terriglobia bacterium]|nr:DUF2071 domain-containing protein [Terriglobia bacterium]
MKPKSKPEQDKERVFLTAEWRYLALLNYPVDPALLLPRVPRGTELDEFNGKTFVSVVGFRFLAAKLKGVPIPFHRDFEEVNLRFYVRRRENGAVKRGVVFIQEIVPRFAIATVARLAYNENYRSLPMAHRIVQSGESPIPQLSVEYSWRLKSARYRLKVVATGEPRLATEGSEEQFISEHYWGYCAQPDGGCVEYHVSHPNWRIWQAAEASLEGNMTEFYGPEFAQYLNRPPDSAFLADGSSVAVYSGKKLAS